MRPTQGTLASTVRSDSAQGATVCPQDEISREYLSFLEHFDFYRFFVSSKISFGNVHGK